MPLTSMNLASYLICIVDCFVSANMIIKSFSLMDTLHKKISIKYMYAKNYSFVYAKKLQLLYVKKTTVTVSCMQKTTVSIHCTKKHLSVTIHIQLNGKSDSP